MVAGEWIALLAWGPACYSLQDRDDWIGWHPAQRAQRLNLIAQNRRFLLLHERGAAPNLASKVLAAAMKALPGQWREHFGYEPVMAETFTDLERFHGTCYKACGWIEAGESQGFGRDAVDFYVYHGKIKRLWVKELAPEARALLCADALPESIPAEIARFAQRLTQPQREKLGLPLKKGTRKFREVPDYQLFYRLLCKTDPDQVADKLTDWLRAQSGSLPGALAMDGKFIRDTVGVLTLADHRDQYGSLHAFTEALSANESEAYRLITTTL